MHPGGVDRQRDFGMILFNMHGFGRFGNFTEFDHAAQMRHAGSGTHHDGHAQLMREPERRNGHVFHFLRGGRFKQGEAEQTAVIAVILLVLAGKEAGIIGIVDDQGALDADVAQRAERVGRHVEPDMFHGTETVQPGHGRTCRRFHGNFFIGAEFHAEGGASLKLEKQRAHFGRRCAGVGAGEIEACFVGSSHQSLIAHEKDFFPGRVFQQITHVVILVRVRGIPRQ